MKWRIYYEGGSTFSSEDGGPELAPTTGVIVIAFESDTPKGWSLCHAKDYYLWREDGWYMADMGGLWDYLLCHKGWKVVLAGRTVRNEEYTATLARAAKEGLGG